jgi:hypothetical protein
MAKNPFLFLLLMMLILPQQLFSSTVKNFQLPETIPMKTEDYSIDSIESGNEPGILKFTISSSHASYQVEGLSHLAKVLHEIEVIERIKRNEQGSGFVNGALSSIEATGDGFVNLVSHPVDSVKGVGKATAKLGRSVRGVFRKKEVGQQGDGFLSGSKRELAKEFKVDAYTTNPNMQALLTSMARARSGGKGAAMVVQFLIPVAGVAAIALTASGVNASADQIVNGSSRGDLYHLNKNALVKLGYGQDDVVKILNTPFYTPREMTYLRVYLEELKEVDGVREIFKKALEAKKDWEAWKILYEAQMAVDLYSEEKFQRLRVLEEGLAALRGSKLIVFTPYDFMDKDLKQQVYKSVHELKREWDFSKIEVWNAGQIERGAVNDTYKEWALLGKDL